MMNAVSSIKTLEEQHPAIEKSDRIEAGRRKNSSRFYPVTLLADDPLLWDQVYRWVRRVSQKLDETTEQGIVVENLEEER